MNTIFKRFFLFIALICTSTVYAEDNDFSCSSPYFTDASYTRHCTYYGNAQSATNIYDAYVPLIQTFSKNINDRGRNYQTEILSTKPILSILPSTNLSRTVTIGHDTYDISVKWETGKKVIMNEEQTCGAREIIIENHKTKGWIVEDTQYTC